MIICNCEECMFCKDKKCIIEVGDVAITIDKNGSCCNKVIPDKFPHIIGEMAEMFVDGKWIKGKIVEGYRYKDGIVTIEADNHIKYWCGESRTDIYRPYKEE